MRTSRTGQLLCAHKRGGPVPCKRRRASKHEARSGEPFHSVYFRTVRANMGCGQSYVAISTASGTESDYKEAFEEVKTLGQGEVRTTVEEGVSYCVLARFFSRMLFSSASSSWLSRREIPCRSHLQSRSSTKVLFSRITFYTRR